MSDDNHWKDRRRTPRRIVRRVQALELEICEAVRILDVSSSGAMVAGAAQPDGASAALRTAPGGVPVVLPLEVRWHRPPSAAATASRVGGEFTRLDSDARRRLEALLSRWT